VIAVTNVLGKSLEVRLTSCYGDSNIKKPWNSTIAGFLAAHTEEIHLVGGDFNQVNLFKGCSNCLTKAVSKYTDIQTLFFPPTKPTRGKNTLDYIFATQQFCETFPISDMTIVSFTQAGFKTVGVKMDHRVLQIAMDIHSNLERRIPILTRIWHKRHVKDFQTRIESIDIPTDTEDDTVQQLCTQLLNTVHHINQKYFGQIFFQAKTSPSGSSDLNWLRRAGAQGGRLFFQSVRSDALCKPLDAGVFPCDEQICNHMGKNHSLCKNPLPPPTYENFPKVQFDLDTFVQALKTNKKKAGQGIPPFIIKIAEKFHAYFLLAINAWMKRGLPHFVLLANLWMLFKKGERLDPACFRPISIPHPLYNIIARMLLVQLQKETDQKLYKYQFGFRKGFSCTEAIVVYRAKVNQLIQNSVDQGTSSLFIDIEKAFDSVPHHSLFKQLEHYLSPPLLGALALLYRKGTPGVPTVNPQSNGKETRQYVQTIGVRQGCPLSPLLFALYINNLLIKINRLSGEQKAFLSAFADDLESTATNDHLPIVATQLEKGFQELDLKISVPKCAVLRLDGQTGVPYTPVLIYGVQVPEVTSFKYLGCFIARSPKAMVSMVYEEHLQWLLHISSLPLTFHERLKLINSVGISRIAYRLAPIVDITGTPKTTIDKTGKHKMNIPKRPLADMESDPNFTIFDRVETAHKDCLLAVTGCSPHVVDQTLYTRQPLGYGLRNTWTVTLGMTALAYTKIVKKRSISLPNTVLQDIENTIFKAVRLAGGQCFGDQPKETMDTFIGNRPHHSANGVNAWQFPLSIYIQTTVSCWGHLTISTILGRFIEGFQNVWGSDITVHSDPNYMCRVAQ